MKPRPALIEPLESRIAPATFVVTSLLDDNSAGTLRFALHQADGAKILATHPVVNKITFKLKPAAADSENTIILTSGALTSLGDVDIIGPGPGKLIITSNNAFGIFNISDGDTTKDSPVSISGLSIVRGTANGAGGVYSTESLSLSNAVISGNTSTTHAGGIAVQGVAGTTVSLTNCLVSGNFGHLDGGIALYNVSKFTVANCVISSNEDDGSSPGGEAGGMFASIISGGTGGTLTNTRVLGNKASFGAGLSFENPNTTKTSSITLKNSTVSGNSTFGNAGTAYGFAGGVFILGGNAAVSNSNIESNTADYAAGGIFTENLNSLTVSHTLFSGNRATTFTNSTVPQGGAALDISGSGSATLAPATITGSQFSGNSSAYDAGALRVEGGIALTITGSKFHGNQAVDTGGAISLHGNGGGKVNATISGSLFADDSASEGGAVYLAGGQSDFTLSSSAVTGCTAGAGGGLKLNTQGAVTLKSLTITDNSGPANTAGTVGGGILIEATPKLLISGCHITGNSSYSGGGLGINSATGAINNTTITGNLAKFQGGGLYLFGGSVTQHGNHISGNTAPNDPDIDGTFAAG